MRVLLLVLFALICSFSAWAGSIDYTKIKAEDYQKLEHRQEFTDKEGFNYRIENTELSKGLYIQETVGGSKQWKKHGIYYKYYEEGKVKKLTTYYYGKKQGLSESYHGKGIVKFREYYHDDLKHGSYEQFFDNGEIIKKCTYEKGQIQGKLYRYQNGNKTYEEDYVDSKRNGVVLQYNSEGKVIARTNYINNNQVGKTERYY